MPEQLSQSQIDALLKKMSSGEVTTENEDRKIRDYDFKSPKKFTKEQLKALNGLHETLSRMLASYFSSLLRTVCEIEVLQVEEQRFYEYNNALSDMALLGLINMKPQEKGLDDAVVLIDLSTTIGFFIIDRVLGGLGTGVNLNRDYTEIELSILTKVFERIAQRVQDSWQNNLEIESSLAGIETNPQLLQVLSPDDIVVIVMMSVRLGNKLDGTLSVCIPGEFLDDVVDRFSPKAARPNKRPDPEKEEIKRRVVLENVCESNLEIEAIFDQFKMELREIMQLQLGDVIPLSKPLDDDILIRVNEIPWSTAKLGETKQKKAIKLSHILSNGNEGILWGKNKTSS